MNKAIPVTLLALILFLAASTPAPAQVDPASLVQQLLTAQNRGDVAAVLALHNDNAVLQGSGLCVASPCVGKAAIQKEIERRVADKAQVKIVSKYVSGNVAVTQFEIQTDSSRKAGVERFIVWGISQVKDDKLAAINLVPQRTDQQTAKYFEWLQSQPPAR
jgi:hypothetical protein